MDRPYFTGVRVSRLAWVHRTLSGWRHHDRKFKWMVSCTSSLTFATVKKGSASATEALKSYLTCYMLFRKPGPEWSWSRFQGVGTFSASPLVFITPSNPYSGFTSRDVTGWESTSCWPGVHNNFVPESCTGFPGIRGVYIQHLGYWPILDLISDSGWVVF